MISENPERAAHVAVLLKAMAHPLRLRIIAALCEGELHVGALADRLESQQAVVSQQLRILRMSGLVDVRRLDGYALYRLAEPNLKDMVACMERCSVNH